MTTLKLNGNVNYCATVVEIKNLVAIENCDNVVHAIIMGNRVIVGKDTKAGEVGLFFPVETQLSKEYLTINNLYNKPDLNLDKTKKGYFDVNGRVRCQKFRGNSSEGFFIPLTSLSYLNIDFMDIPLGSTFDDVNGNTICTKYIVTKRGSGLVNPKKDKSPKESKLVDNQFKFHKDTEQLYRNTNRVHPNDIVSITYKMHGTSFIASNILCKKSLKWYEKALRSMGVKIVDTAYDNVWASRKVLKNSDLNPNANHFYDVDIWGIADQELREYLAEGMTIYGEVVGFLPSGSLVQPSYDYGCNPKEHKLYIYRITYTNVKGKVFEFSAKQVQDFCAENGLIAVPELYYGYAKYLYDNIICDTDGNEVNLSEYDLNTWQENFLEAVKEKYNEKDCYICHNKVPEEGCVVRVEKNNFEGFKCKSVRFYEFETEQLNKGVADIESEN